MIRKLLLVIIGLSIGLGVGYLTATKYPAVSLSSNIDTLVHNPLALFKPKVIGFLPYWLVDKAKKDYSKTISNLTYFSLTIDSDGKLLKLLNDTEEEPGWNALHSGRMDEHFENAKKSNIDLSLTLFNGNEESIGELISDPIPHARNLAKEIDPIMKRYEFKEVNLDIESVKEASGEARSNFTAFIKEFKKNLDEKNLGALTIDASPTIFIRKYLINPKEIEPYIDHMVIMAYDYHYPTSIVTGPVAPLGGAGIVSEFDTQVGVQAALNMIPAHKLILGIPLYGYEWETIADMPRSVVIPGSGQTASGSRIEKLIEECASCSSGLEKEAVERYVTFKDDEVGTYHQIYYPDDHVTQSKIDLARKNNLGGLALWALGYEDSTILEPISAYK